MFYFISSTYSSSHLLSANIKFSNIFLYRYLLFYQKQTTIINVFYLYYFLGRIFSLLELLIQSGGHFFFLYSRKHFINLFFDVFDERVFNFSLVDWRPGFFSNNAFFSISLQNSLLFKEIWHSSIILIYDFKVHKKIINDLSKIYIPFILVNNTDVPVSNINYFIPLNHSSIKTFFFFLMVLRNFSTFVFSIVRKYHLRLFISNFL